MTERSRLCRFPDSRGVYHLRCEMIVQHPRGEDAPRQCRLAAQCGSKYCEAHRIETVAAAIWDAYQASPIVTEGSAGLTWGDLVGLATKHPGKAAAVIRRTALAEARAAIKAVDASTREGI